MSEEAGAAPTAASADGAVADATMADAPPAVETDEAEAVDHALYIWRLAWFSDVRNLRL